MSLVLDTPATDNGVKRDSDAEYLSKLYEATRDEMRKAIQREMDAFLTSGGSITEIEPHVMADPPTKPVSGYGKGAI